MFHVQLIGVLGLFAIAFCWGLAVVLYFVKKGPDTIFKNKLYPAPFVPAASIRRLRPRTAGVNLRHTFGEQGAEQLISSASTPRFGLVNKHPVRKGAAPPYRLRLKLLAAAISLACMTGTATGWAQESEQQHSTILEEVIVTAQKRGNESLQDVAMSVAVIGKDMIDLKQLVGMDDYLRTIPSVTFQDYGAGRSTIIIRGISADPQEANETSSVYINETPISGMGDFETSSPDLKLVDINRIEILRGPQGTLYGASSLGGTVRIITEEPQLDAFNGSLAGSWSYTDDLGSDNYDLQGIINIPLKEDVFAIRAVAYYFDNSGFYQNIAASDPDKVASAEETGALVLNRNNMGASTYSGGRIAALWAPTDKLSLNLMFLAQKVEQEGRPVGDLALGEFEHARYSRYSTGRGEYMNDHLNITTLLVKYDFGPVALVSSSSWNDYDNEDDQDFGNFSVDFLGADYPIFLNNSTTTDIFVQEVRVDSQWDNPLQFLVGLYYENRDLIWAQFVDWDGDPAFDIFGGELLLDGEQMNFTKQKAVFGELSWSFTDQLVGTAGMRYFDYSKSFDFIGDGIFFGGPVSESLSTDENGETYKLNLSYTPTDRSLYYVQWSQGFRLGEPFGSPPAVCDLDGDGLIDGLGIASQEQLNSDTLDSYEVGAKLASSDNRVNLRTAVFYNQWSEIPVTRTGDCGFIFLFNAGEAKTSGVEFEGSAQLSTQWRLDFSAGYLDGKLTRDAPGLGNDGDRLPGIPKYNAALGLQYDFRYREHDGYLRGDLATVGGFYNNLQEEGEEIGDYTTLNLVSGIQLGQFDVQLFINNVTNSHATTWIDQRPEFQSAYRLRPRTAGVSLRYTFGEVN